MSVVEVKDVGPVRHLQIPVPAEGGLVCLKGTNDIGKSETLEAIEAAISGRGKLDVRRGAVKGEVTALGVTIRVGRSNKRSGELEVASLEGKFSIEDLIDPKIKDPGAADAKRIKTLLQIAGQAPSPELFHGLFGGREQFEACVSDAAVKADDIVVMADRIKRDVEAKARDSESASQHADGRARGAREAAGGVDFDAESDELTLSKRLEDAIREESRIKAQALAGYEAEQKIEQARSELAKAEASYDGPSPEAALAIEQQEQQKLRGINDEIVAIEAQLADAKNRLRVQVGAVSNAATVRSAAARHVQMISKWHEQLLLQVPEIPGDGQILSASVAVAEARQALERGAIVRRAKDHVRIADQYAAEAHTHTRRADSLRNIARGVDDVLSGLVAQCGTPFFVDSGRLMIIDPSSGSKTYAELSHGRRSKIALDVAIQAVGDGGAFVVKQEFFEGIAPAKQKELAEHVRGRGVLVFTAKATDDQEITAEVL